MKAASHWPPTSSPALLAWQMAMNGMIEGDRELVRAAFSSDAAWYDIFLGSLRGGEAIAEHLGGMKGRDFDSTEVRVLRMLADDRDGAIEWVQTVTSADRSIRLEGVTIVTVSEGQITRLCDYIQPLISRNPR